ncbi:MAG: aldo/keto reductase [Planctomycetes bacterium]|nr:aldo/keto reductase [Planctomycetota bacterium]
MRTRKLGKTDLDLTTIGLGTWAIGGPWEFGWGAQDDDDSVATIIAALESGINWIDTAAIYGCGHSETVVGRAIREFGQRTIVATKCSLLWNEQRCKVSCLDADSIIKECEDSLHRLGVEVIDLYQMHWPAPDEKIEEGWQAMIHLRDQGKVRYIGVSNYIVDQLDRISKFETPASLQPQYSMLGREIEADLLPYCDEHDMGVVAYSPMHRGLLTGKFTADKIAELAEDDHRHGVPDFNEPRLSANLQFVENLRPIADNYGITLAQLALAWVLNRKEITSAIAGARHPGQIKETVQASDIDLNETTIEQIDELLEDRNRKIN